MAIFIVTSNSESSFLASAISKTYPTDHIQLGPNQWLVAAPLTARQLTDKLEISSGKAGANVFVGGLNSYFGLHRPEIWEWIKVKWESGAHSGATG